MIGVLFAPGSVPFSVALLVMLGLTLVELVGVLTGSSVNDMADSLIDADLPGPHSAAHGLDAVSHDTGGSLWGRFLGWLHVGRVPVLMVLIVWLAVFGLCGLLLQEMLRQLLDHTAPAILAGPAVFVATLPLVRLCVAALARIMPRDETSAVDPRSFVGLTALIVGGTARAGLAAQGRLTDRFGTDHYLLIEPDDAEDQFPQGSVVLIIRELSGGRWSAIPNPNPSLTDRQA